MVLLRSSEMKAHGHVVIWSYFRKSMRSLALIEAQQIEEQCSSDSDDSFHSLPDEISSLMDKKDLARMAHSYARLENSLLNLVK